MTETVLLQAVPIALSLALTAAQPEVLVVVPLGEPSPDLIEIVVQSLSERFNFEVRVAPPMALPRDAWYAPRQRWRAEKILDALDEQNFDGAWRVAAITEVPISTTKGKIYDWGIAGLGSMGGKSSVFTSYLFHKVRKDRATYLRFMENLVLHEVGHTLGLEHCPLEKCIMADAKGDAIKAARLSDNQFCPRCAASIREHLKP